MESIACEEIVADLTVLDKEAVLKVVERAFASRLKIADLLQSKMPEVRAGVLEFLRKMRALSKNACVTDISGFSQQSRNPGVVFR